MDKISIIVVLLGIISVGAGFAAEFTRVKASKIKVGVNGRCLYPSSPALFFSIISTASLLIAKIIINLATGCFCCKARIAQSHTSSNRSKALCFYVVFWISFLIAISLLLAGAKLNERRDDVVEKNGRYICYYIKAGMFASGAVLAGLCCIFGVIYYRTLSSKAKDAGNAQNQGGIAMAHPQFPF